MLRGDGSKLVSARELKVIKRLMKAGHPYKHMSEMLGRTELALQRLAGYYDIERHEWYATANKIYSTELTDQIKASMEEWIEVRRLTAREMHRLVTRLYCPTMHYAKVCKLIQELPKDVRAEHKRNVRDRKSRNATLQHRRSRLRKKACKKSISTTSGTSISA